MGTKATVITAPINTIRNAGFNITRFIDCSARRYPMSLSFPIPGVTALDQVKKIPAIKPVDNVANIKMIVSIFMIMSLIR